MVGRSGRSSSTVVGQRTDYEPEFCEWCAGCCRAEPGKQQKYYPAVVVDNDEEYSMKWLFCCTTTGLGAAGCSGWLRTTTFRIRRWLAALAEGSTSTRVEEEETVVVVWYGMPESSSSTEVLSSVRRSLRPPQPTTTRYM